MKDVRLIRLLLAFFLVGIAPTASAQEEVLRFGDPPGMTYEQAFFAGAQYDPKIPHPKEILGQPIGSRTAHHHEILAAFEEMVAASPRARMQAYARSHEGRRLWWCAISTPENLARLEQIRSRLGRLRDPRGLSDDEAESILAETPAVAWMGYSIHGDELSGADASMAVAYHLIADQSEANRALLDQVVVVIDPVMNPDGRERIIGMLEQAAGQVPNLDYGSQQRGRWPWGRGNHYLFDMNRDWMFGTQPETRGRWRAARGFYPQLFVDSHEMGSLDTFLFYPQSPPHNPHLPARLSHWQSVFADRAGRAFDRHGWAYYTREWADAWSPHYSDSWGSLNGAIGILYEQAGIGGQPLRRRSGVILTYRECVHHQATASISNLESLHEHRREILQDYLAQARRNVDPGTPGNDEMIVIRPSLHPGRVSDLAARLLDQGIEIQVAEEAFVAREVRGVLGEEQAEQRFPAGSYVIATAQAQSALIRSFLAFDPRMEAEFLRDERESLEREGDSKIYDVSAWSLLRALDLDASWCNASRVPSHALDHDELNLGVTPTPNAASALPTAYVVDGALDTSVSFAARAMEHGLAVHIGDREFSAGGRAWVRGSLILRRNDNHEAFDRRLARVVEELGVSATPVFSGRSPDQGPDLGGQHFHLLRRPRAAILSNEPVRASDFGHLWHHLDTRIGLPLSMLDAADFGGFDLRRYNVLIFPPGGSSLIRRHAQALQSWVRGGGTLVLVADSAAAACAPQLGLARTRLRRDVLEELEAYLFVAKRESKARDVEVDPAVVYGDRPGASSAKADQAEPPASSDPDRERQDAWARRFAPAGAILKAEVDPQHWLGYGARAQMPVHVSGSRVFLSPSFGQSPLRLADRDQLRLGGLLWPEAAERFANSSYVVAEPSGRGQYILFQSQPAFRGMWRSTARLFSQAVVYGPGLGARQPLDW